MKARVNDIKVNNRQRKTLTHMEELSNSIARVGLIHPIVVDAEGNLIAGERRLSACKMLKWDEVPIVLKNDLSEFQKKEIELEENIMRKDLPWQDEVAAKSELDELKRELYGDAYPGQGTGSWGIKDTAESLGESIGNTSMDIQVAEALKLFPELGDAKSKTRAYHQFKQLIDSTIRQVTAEDANQDLDMCELIHGDCVEELKKIESESVDLIITDPPFGVGLDKNTIGDAYVHKYEDSKKTWTDMMVKVVPELYRVLKPGCHMYIFFASQYYTDLRYMIESTTEFNLDGTPCIWYKGARRANPAAPQRRFRYVYEPFFFCWKGQQRLLRKDADAVFAYPPISGHNKIHLAEKPAEIGSDLCQLSSVEGEVVLDAFAGSGSLIHPSYQLGRRVIGIEKEKDFYNMLLERFANEANDDSTE